VKILLVDDSQRLLRSLGLGLKKLGYAVDVAADGENGLALAETYDYQVIVLDLMLPGLPGLEVLRRLRTRGSGAHVLILSARDRVDDRVKGLELGADDYLVKPFAFEELCARIQALVRRRHQAKNPVIRLGSLEIDAARRQVSRSGDALHLTPSEYAILEFLAYQRSRVFSKEQLVEHLHRSDSDVSSNVIEVLVSGLRKDPRQKGFDLPRGKVRSLVDVAPTRACSSQVGRHLLLVAGLLGIIASLEIRPGLAAKAGRSHSQRSRPGREVRRHMPVRARSQ
jgi:DNA-binding response OmpR family regulator